MLKTLNDLELNLSQETERIAEIIQSNVKNYFRKEGAVVGLSGGIDSAVTAALCVKALGKENVLGISLPEKESDKEGILLAEELASNLGIKFVKHDITKILESFNVYENILNIIKSYYPEFSHEHKYKISLPQDILNKQQLNIYSLIIIDDQGKEIIKKRFSFDDYKSFQAAISIKLRTRMTMLYYYAEKFNRIVAGTTNRTEYDLGNFCKYGDGGVDMEVISHLYKTQVFQIAEYLNIPDKICMRVPSPDICSAFVSDTEFFFSLPFKILDKLLYAYNNKAGIEITSQNLNLNEQQVKRVFDDFQKKQNNTIQLKKLPPICGIL